MMHDTLALIAKSRSTGSPSSLFALHGELGEKSQKLLPLMEGGTQGAPPLTEG